MQSFEACLNGKPVGFCAVVHCKGKVLNQKRISRLVVLPDYQGIGIGYALATYLARYYAKLGYVLGLVTSAKNLIYKLSRAGEWDMFSYANGAKDKIMRRVTDRKMASFRYVGPDAVRYRRHTPVRYTRSKSR